MRSKLATRFQSLTQRLPGMAPAVPPAPDDYAAQFAASADAFRSFIRRWTAPALAAGQPAGIVVTPWVKTPVPWYSIALAMGLAERGQPVRLIWDDLGLAECDSEVGSQTARIGAILRELSPRLAYTRLSECAAVPNQPGDSERLQKLAELNAIWSRRAAPADEHHARLRQEYESALVHMLPLIRGLLSAQAFAYLLVPGGVRAASSLFLWAGQERGTRVATYDANFGVVQISTDGIASQQSDLPLAFRQFLSPQISEAERAEAVIEAQRHLQLRVEGRDLARYQYAPPSAEGQVYQPDVLIPLNIDYDSAALGRHYLFADTVEWITATVAFILEHSDSTVAVRQHPAERHTHERSELDLAAVLLDRFGRTPRVRFIAAEAPINTYDLVKTARLVLPFVSTIGIEAIALGRPVVVAGNSCYSDLGFVWRVDTVPEYFDLVARGARGELTVSAERRRAAWLCYYLTPVCNRIWTDFTPQAPDFGKWSQKPISEVFADPAVQDILTAVNDNIPAAIVRHQRRQVEQPAR